MNDLATKSEAGLVLAMVRTIVRYLLVFASLLVALPFLWMAAEMRLPGAIDILLRLSGYGRETEARMTALCAEMERRRNPRDAREENDT